MASELTPEQLAMPLVPNPDGSPPNYIDPPSLAPAMTGVGVSLTVVTALLVVIRICTNAKSARVRRGRLGVDDVFCVTALLLAVPFAGVQLSMEETARHAWDVPLGAIADPAYIKKTFVVSVLIGPVFFFSKSAILLFYFYVFKPKKWLRIAVWCGLVVLFIIYFVDIPAAFVLCMPASGEEWDLVVLTKCKSMGSWAKALNVTNILADLYIIVLPLPIILKLQQTLRTRLAIAAVFGTGVFGLIASAMSLYYRVIVFSDIDSSWVATQTYLCVMTEAYVAISVSCMPFLPSFWSRFVVKTPLYATARSMLRSMRPSKTTSSLSKNHDDFDATSRSSEEPFLEMRRPPKLKIRDRGRVYDFVDASLPDRKTNGSEGIMKSVTLDMVESRI